jgi:hypothetical protein
MSNVESEGELYMKARKHEETYGQYEDSMGYSDVKEWLDEAKAEIYASFPQKTNIEIETPCSDCNTTAIYEGYQTEEVSKLMEIIKMYFGESK